MSITILAIGLMIFFAHFLSLQFRKTNIPDVLVLMLAGILLGPVLGVVTPQDFGKIGSLVATIALVVILFESGTSLNLGVLGKSLATTGVLALSITLTNFEQFGLTRIQRLSNKIIVPLNEIDRVFYRESVLLLKTYFFVYLGISIHFGAAHLALTAIVMTVLVLAMRTGLTRFVYRDAGYTLRDSVITSMMAPKGLAAAKPSATQPTW